MSSFDSRSVEIHASVRGCVESTSSLHHFPMASNAVSFVIGRASCMPDVPTLQRSSWPSLLHRVVAPGLEVSLRSHLEDLLVQFGVRKKLLETLVFDLELSQAFSFVRLHPAV